MRAGSVEEWAIDRKVRRILRLAARVGLLDGHGIRIDAAPPAPMEAHRAFVRRAAADGMVLLSNDGLLPLAAPATIAVIGEGALVARTQGGGSATVLPASVVTPIEGLRRRFPAADVAWSLGAVVQKGLAPLEPGTFHTPDGEPGLLVRFLDAAGTETGREHRQASWLTWFDGASVATAATEVEFAFRWNPGAAGPARLGVGGLADVVVRVDGAVVASVTPRTQPGDDPATAVLNPPFDVVDLPHATGPIDVTVRFRPVPGGIPDSLALRVGLPPADADPAALIAQASHVASTAEVAVVVVSTSNEVESEGFDRVDLRLPGHQDDLVRAVAAVNPRTVVVVNSGAPVLLPWLDEVSACLAVWFPGQEFGDALADVLSGDVEPGGRLPVTWPRDEASIPVTTVTPEGGRLEYSEGLEIGYRAWQRARREPAFWFGHGLGYTTWELSDLWVAAAGPGSGARARLTVRNTGTRTGKCVVQAYLSRDDSAITRPPRWLAAFVAVEVNAGDSVVVELELPQRAFSHWNSTQWSVEPGSFDVQIGLSALDTPSQLWSSR